MSPFFTSARGRMTGHRSMAVGGRELLKFMKDLQINSEIEENGCCVLCGLDYYESYVWSWCIIWSVSLTCDSIYHLYLVMTRPLIWTACTHVALWICIHCVPADTPDIPTVFLLSLSSAQKFRLSARLDQGSLQNCSNFSLSANRPTLCSRKILLKIEKGRGTEWKEGRKKEERNKEKERKAVSVNSICYIKKPYEQIYENCVLESVTCEMLTSS